ncbi:MAG: DegV family protein [Lachnospiraceae bacterium]|nr:DegV family protein [Lachnospiraceae bacterium]
MYRIIIDSCGELTEEMKKNPHISSVPLTLMVDGEEIIDDETFDQASFLSKVAKSIKGPKSACPAPGLFLEEIEKEEDHVYIVTLSAQLSGSYNSALTAQKMYEEDHPGDTSKKIHVFDSKSASIGETLIAQKIRECEDNTMSFEEVIKKVEEYITSQHTFFVLETLESFRKNGRISWQKEKIASVLNIKPVMGSTDIGGITQLAKARGMMSALDKMVDCLLTVTKNTESRIVAISHCNCLHKAEILKNKLLEKAKFKDIFILDTAGVSSLYACDGGIIMVV